VVKTNILDSVYLKVRYKTAQALIGLKCRRPPKVSLPVIYKNVCVLITLGKMRQSIFDNEKYFAGYAN
jgi:hypothetical protein